MSHPIFTLLTALLLSLAMAAVEHRPARARLYVALRVFFCCTVTVLSGSWLMRLIHG